VGSVSGVPSSAIVTALVYDSVVGSGNLTPLDELKSLDQQIDQIQSLAGLQPLFARLEELAKQHSGDFEVQLVAHDVKQHMLTRGSRIKQLQPPPPVATPLPAPVVDQAEAKPRKRRGLLWALAALGAIAVAAVVVNVMHDRDLQRAAAAPVDAKITSVPPGAEILIAGKPVCKSDCVTPLAPGTYEVSAALEGYDPAVASLLVSAGKPAALSFTLNAQPVSVRIFADLGTGKVFLDDQPAGELLDGQFTLERLEPGSHKLRITGGSSEAVLSLVAAPASMPAIDSLIQTKNLLAIAVTNFGDKARLVASSGPLKLMLNGQSEADATPDGTELTNFHTGAAELVVGEAPSQRTLTGTFSAAPALTAFLKTDQKIGTLLIATGEDDVRIFLNDREQKRRTAKGQARIQTIGDVLVRVEKPGFEPVAAQNAKVAQGTETRLNFTLKELPKFAALSVSGAAPGMQILLSERVLGVVGNDGAFRNTTITPGEHTIELRRDQFEPKRMTRMFRAGETVVIGVGEATLTAVRLPPPPVVSPPPAVVRTEPQPPKPAPRARAAGTMANFDNPGAWKEEDGVWKHRGAATLTYSHSPDGIFTFSIYMLKGGGFLRGGKVSWFLNYTDAKNYALFELNEESFWAKVVQNGKTLERKKVAHRQDKSMRVWNIQIDAGAQRLVHKIQGDAGWVDLDSWSEPGRDFTKGKFGILVNGTDEVGLSNFTFTGR
jgi:hypothetical protein